MSENKRLKELQDILNFKTQSAFAEALGIKQGSLSDIYREKKDVGVSESIKRTLEKEYSINIEWLEKGEGETFIPTISEECEHNLVPLLPISAQGGSLNDFIVSVNGNGYEKIISPIKGADFAITVSGQSMAPEYSSGSKILIKKINEKSFIEWGRCYVLDTCNGTVIKKLTPPEEEDPDFGFNYVTCVSVNQNPIYKAFRVSTKDIYGMYRVLMLLTEK